MYTLSGGLEDVVAGKQVNSGQRPTHDGTSRRHVGGLPSMVLLPWLFSFPCFHPLLISVSLNLRLRYDRTTPAVANVARNERTNENPWRENFKSSSLDLLFPPSAP